MIGTKNIEDSIKDRLIITAKTTGIFFALKEANVKSPKASLDAIDIMKLAGRICKEVLVKDYAVYKKWINRSCNKNFMALLSTIKLYHAKQAKCLSLGPDQPGIIYRATKTCP